MAVKRILYCEGNIDGTVGGSFFSLLYLIEGLDRAEFEPIAVFHREHALIPSYRAAGIDTRVLPQPNPLVLPTPLLKPAQRGLNMLRYLLLYALRLARMLKRERIDLLHLNNSITRNHPWMLAARLAGVPCITHERGINSYYSGLSRWLGRGLERVICISDAVRDNFARCHVEGLKLTTIYNGLDPDILHANRQPEALRAEFGIATGRRLLVMLGNIKEWKGQECVVRAMQLVKARYPEALCLFVGDTAESDCYYKEHLDALIREFNLEKQVLFTGYQKNIADFLNAAEAMIHASIDPEPFGRVLIEAMAMSCPVIGASEGAVSEIVVPGVTGYLFTPGNPQSLAEAIGRIMALSKENRLAIGEAGRKRMEKYFHIKENIRYTVELYKEILA